MPVRVLGGRLDRRTIPVGIARGVHTHQVRRPLIRVDLLPHVASGTDGGVRVRGVRVRVRVREVRVRPPVRERIPGARKGHEAGEEERRQPEREGVSHAAMYPARLRACHQSAGGHARVGDRLPLSGVGQRA